MAVFDINGLAVNTRYIVSIGDIRESVNAGYFHFAVSMHGRDAISARYPSKEEAESQRASLIASMER
ncbi:hypothetical protein [Luteibacter sp. E-22]|uniref:hypothetical protein n=1 Tax=Luteibacter sp. E-22 TaxID=3404050 RepID=UPI003CF1B6F1